VGNQRFAHVAGQTRLAPVFAVKNVSLGHAMLSRFHELRLDQILNGLDLQRLALHRPGHHRLHHGIGDMNGAGLHSGRQWLIRRQAGIGLEGGFDGEENAGFVEGNNASVAFVNGKFPPLERVQLSQPELAVELFVQHVR
jgi:hypothetical protein